MTDMHSVERSSIVDFGAARHERVKQAGAAARSRVIERMQAKQLDAAQRLSLASARLAFLLERGHLYTSPVINEAERAVYAAANDLAGQDTFAEWAAYLGITE